MLCLPKRGLHRGNRPFGEDFLNRESWGVMAGGWARDGAVSEQIEASISDELARMKSRRGPVGNSLSHCAECEEPIPEARRLAVPGVKLCVECVAQRDAAVQRRGGINRRGSKDSQLK